MATTALGLKGLKKIDWNIVRRTLIGIGVVLGLCNLAAGGIGEGNLMALFGVAALIAGFVMFDEAEDQYGFWRYVYVSAYSILFALFFLAPLLHFTTRGKVWVVDGKTTLNSDILIRSPFAPLATSIQKRQYLSGSLNALTKNGVTVSGFVTGEFRLSDDERVVLSRFAALEDPNKEIDDLLMKTLSESFEKTIARMSVAEIAALPSTFTLEVGIGDAATAVNLLGLKRNGSIVVSSLHPYFVDK